MLPAEKKVVVRKQALWRSWVGIAAVALLGSGPAYAQLRLIPEAARQVYAALPDLPLENGYTPVNPNDGGPAPEEDTLVRRMMVYHLQVVGRSPTDRFDWQLTLADYLDANEPIVAQRYPGAERLTVNPYAQDKAAVQALTRQQRQALLRAILLAFGGDPDPKPLYIPTALNPVPAPPTPEPLQRLPIPGAGSADLLRP
ncbi:hypothetical protein [Synechococcus sp. H60.4]|uniref:hypothetical protein n=1 Tax=Synechococcus sp. H60.4 TaxID=2964519 RepID=UPI0039C1D154